MPAWLLLSLVSLVLVGTADLLFRRATLSRFTPASFMVVHSLFFGPTALVWAVATGSLEWNPASLWGLVTGALTFVSSYSFLRSLQAPGGQVSANAPIYRLNLVITAILAISFLGEIITWAKVTGLLLAATAVLLLAETSLRSFGSRPGGGGLGLCGHVRIRPCPFCVQNCGYARGTSAYVDFRAVLLLYRHCSLLLDLGGGRPAADSQHLGPRPYLRHSERQRAHSAGLGPPVGRGQ